ncbi:MAG: nucleotidyltransferase domain-containing protein [Oscillospiraceae bacterium]|nr:nucleotidyltransferase domain-containing protein [Oscillospiraceae bacterium]
MLDLPQINKIVEPLLECDEVIGLCLMGSYSAGDANELSDLDIGVFFQENVTALPKIDVPCAYDYYLLGINERKQLNMHCEWNWRASAFLSAKILFDRNGQAKKFIEEIIKAKNYNEELRREQWDRYLNGLYRSLKYHRKNVEYGHLACAAESVLAYFEALYFDNELVAPLPGREQASLWRLYKKPIKDDFIQMNLLTQILRDGSTKSQSELFSYAEPYIIEQGMAEVIDAWEGLIHLEIDRAKY